MCAASWNLDEKPNGECPTCGEPTFDGQAIKGCNYSPTMCEDCGDAPCDLSC